MNRKYVLGRRKHDIQTNKFSIKRYSYSSLFCNDAVQPSPSMISEETLWGGILIIPSD